MNYQIKCESMKKTENVHDMKFDSKILLMEG